MQLLPSASPLGASAASDTPTSDTRPATDPANAGAFQAALSAARQGNGSSAVERPAGRPTAPSRQDDDATATDAEPLADATDSGDEMAALLMWLVPLQAPQTPAAPIVIPTTGDAPSGEATAPVAAASAATSAVPTSQIGQPGSQIGQPGNQSSPRLGTAAQTAPGASNTAPLTIDDLLAPTAPSAGPTGQLTAFAASPADATLANAIPATSGGIPIPPELLTGPAATTSVPLPANIQTAQAVPSTTIPLTAVAPDDLSTIAAAAATSSSPTAAAATETAPVASSPTLVTPATTNATTAAQAATTIGTTVASSAQTPGRRTQVTGATTATTTSVTASPDTTPRAEDATIVASDPTADGTIPAASAPTTAASAPQTAPATTWASLAAAVYPDVGGGARIVAATTPTATRPAGQAGPRTDQTLVPADAQIPGDGSTAQAAGAAITPGIQLPGRAVAAAGSPADATPGSFAEALAAGPTTTTTTRRTQAGAPTEINAAAIGATSTVGQTQAAGPVEASATAAPPITSQIADLTQVASRRLGQSVQMVLQPEGLGTVTLRVTVERAGLAVHLAVDNAQTRQMVQASWPQLQQALDQRGLTVHSMLLDLSQGRGNGEAFQAFQQFTGQQQSNGHQSRGSSSSADRRGAVATVDEVARPQSGVGSSSRVDYRI